jgi:hypothetical protein
MQTALVRRVLGDAVGCVTLAALVGLLVYVWPGETTPSKFKELFPPIFVVLAIVGYPCWIKKEKAMPDDSWLKGALLFFGFGMVSLACDILIGYLFDHPASLLEAPLKVGIPFAVTLLLCPGFTFISLAGWTRNLMIRRRESHA